LVAGGPPAADTCAPDTVADCAAAVASSSTKTYVVALGTEPGILDPIAAQGGSGKAFPIDVQLDFSGPLTDVVRQIRAAEAGCEYALPPVGAGLDYRTINLEIAGLVSSTPSASTVVVQVKNRQACDGTSLEWYYDDPYHPTRVITCGSTCNAIHTSSGTSARILVGCQTLTAGIPIP
jgi:hypothetical protein